MKKINLIITIMSSCFATKAQSIAERIGTAMNRSDFFGLHEIFCKIMRNFAT